MMPSNWATLFHFFELCCKSCTIFFSFAPSLRLLAHVNLAIIIKESFIFGTFTLNNILLNLVRTNVLYVLYNARFHCRTE